MKQLNLWYMNTTTGEITQNHTEAVGWFREGADVELYVNGKYRMNWTH